MLENTEFPGFKFFDFNYEIIKSIYRSFTINGKKYSNFVKFKRDAIINDIKEGVKNQTIHYYDDLLPFNEQITTTGVLLHGISDLSEDTVTIEVFEMIAVNYGYKATTDEPLYTYKVFYKDLTFPQLYYVANIATRDNSFILE